MRISSTLCPARDSQERNPDEEKFDDFVVTRDREGRDVASDHAEAEKNEQSDEAQDGRPSAEGGDGAVERSENACDHWMIP
jgi:hypothetical protein